MANIKKFSRTYCGTTEREIRINFQNFLYLLYLCVFLLEINIKMCKIYTTILISCLNVQCYITEFNMVQKLKCYSLAGVISALVLRLNKIRKATLKTLETNIVMFSNFYTFWYAFKVNVPKEKLTWSKFNQKMIPISWIGKTRCNIWQASRAKL